MATVTVSHILLKYASSRPGTSWQTPFITRTVSEAIAIVASAQQRIVGGDVSCATLASELSDCSTARAGGNLGPIERGQMQDLFEAAALALTFGEMSGIDGTDRGFYIILRVE
eukprot:contig_18666_g4586